MSSTPALNRLPGKGFRVARFTAAERALLGRSVRITLPNLTVIHGQVWSQADPTLIGSREATAFFAVAGGTAYVFHVDPRRPFEPSTGRAVANGRIGDRVFVAPLADVATDVALECAS